MARWVGIVSAVWRGGVGWYRVSALWHGGLLLSILKGEWWVVIELVLYGS